MSEFALQASKQREIISKKPTCHKTLK